MIDRFPLPSKLCSIVTVLPKLAASCEGGFSINNSVKNIFRSSLQETSSSGLMTININVPGLGDIDAKQWVEH
jgi:hypothetical protein